VDPALRGRPRRAPVVGGGGWWPRGPTDDAGGPRSPLLDPDPRPLPPLPPTGRVVVNSSGIGLVLFLLNNPRLLSRWNRSARERPCRLRRRAGGAPCRSPSSPARVSSALRCRATLTARPPITLLTPASSLAVSSAARLFPLPSLRARGRVSGRAARLRHGRPTAPGALCSTALSGRDRPRFGRGPSRRGMSRLTGARLSALAYSPVPSRTTPRVVCRVRFRRYLSEGFLETRLFCFLDLDLSGAPTLTPRLLVQERGSLGPRLAVRGRGFGRDLTVEVARRHVQRRLGRGAGWARRRGACGHLLCERPYLRLRDRARRPRVRLFLTSTRQLFNTAAAVYDSTDSCSSSSARLKGLENSKPMSDKWVRAVMLQGAAAALRVSRPASDPDWVPLPAAGGCGMSEGR